MKDMNTPSISAVTRQAVDKCLRQNIPFALYAVPGTDRYTFMASAPTDDEFLNDHQTTEGAFEISFFAHSNPSPIVILPQYSATDVLALPDNIQYPGADTYPAIQSTSAIAYMAQVHELAKTARSIHGKVVLSRIIAGKAEGISPLDVALKYFEGQEGTLRYIFFTQETGLWIGATPELLVSFRPDAASDQHGRISTMALAGTRIHPTETDDEAWDDKNVAEQQFVSRHISTCLHEAGLDTVETSDSTLRLKNVEHICSMFTTQGSLQQALKLRESLDPTPAVGGYPTDAAIGLINYFETHERLCYAGTINIRDTSGTGFNTFVNLRSMLIAPENDGDYRSAFLYNIYVGGGITAASQPETEWSETAEKASLMLDALSRGDETHADNATLYDQINIEVQESPSFLSGPF